MTSRLLIQMRAASSNPAHAGFLSGHTWEGLSATYGLAVGLPYPATSNYKAGHHHMKWNICEGSGKTPIKQINQRLSGKIFLYPYLKKKILQLCLAYWCIPNTGQGVISELLLLIYSHVTSWHRVKVLYRRGSFPPIWSEYRTSVIWTYINNSYNTTCMPTDQTHLNIKKEKEYL